jgi:aspartate aminotransferase-like enzyme
MADSTKQVLMTPGPVPLPPEVLDVLALPMEHHRTIEFMALYARVLTNLQKVFVSSEPAFIHTSTGSGGMESAIVNTLSPGDHVLCVVSGKFGERWAEMADVFGVRVTRLQVEWGKVVRVEEIERHLRAHPETKAVLTQACETSTGVLHPIREIANVVRKTKAILMVDAITALGAVPLPMDEWGIDIMIGGSQKAFMLPTGLSFISFSKKAWALTETSKIPKFYFNIRSEKAANEKGESYFSTSVTHIRALDFVIELFLKVGMHKVHERIQTLSKATLIASRELGLKILSEVPSPSVTAILMPDGVDSQKVRAHMEKNANVIVMGGQDHLKSKIIRIGHMGAISDDDLLLTLTALVQAIQSLKTDVISDEAFERALSEMRKILDETPAVLTDSRRTL